jgi:D-sedoheptulose 7-phosphate isomerase
MHPEIITCIEESVSTKKKLLSDEALLATIDNIAIDAVEAIRNDGKLIICGNGGSASDSLHFAGEILGRFQTERNPWPAVALNADVAAITSISNDYGYAEVFARQARGLAKPEDLFIGISTSGNSENVLRAARVCSEIGCRTAALLGKTGGMIRKVVDNALVVPSDRTARIQECHILCIHIICQIIEAELA